MQDNHEFPILTVDCVLFQLIKDKLSLLIIKRAFEPHKGEPALPGVYVSKDEPTKLALKRVLKDKTGIEASKVVFIDQPYAFDMPKRDPRGYAVTVMYIGLTKNLRLSGQESLQNPEFIEINSIPKLAYDHGNIVKFAHDRIKSLAMSTNVVARLLPKHFTFLQLQSAYEAILGAKLDKRNFRKKMLQHGLVESANKIEKDGAHRPAELYKFVETTPNIFK